MDPFLCSVYLMKCHERGVHQDDFWKFASDFSKNADFQRPIQAKVEGRWDTFSFFL